jgi:hypothetical protein
MKMHCSKKSLLGLLQSAAAETSSRGALSNQHFQMNPNNGEPVFRMLVNSPNKIGWQDLFKGRFSKEWTQIQGRRVLEDDPELDHETRWATDGSNSCHTIRGLSLETLAHLKGRSSRPR